jgi:hypothetical protein
MKGPRLRRFHTQETAIESSANDWVALYRTLGRLAAGHRQPPGASRQNVFASAIQGRQHSGGVSGFFPFARVVFLMGQHVADVNLVSGVSA